MMFYAIVAEDRADSLSARLADRPAHLERLQVLQAQGRLLLAGPFPAIDAADPGSAGFSGSLIVAEFDSLETAKDWAEDDPYVHANVYTKVTVRPFKKTFPA